MITRATFIAACLISTLVLGLIVTAGCTMLGRLPLIDSHKTKANRYGAAHEAESSTGGFPCYGYHRTQWSTWPEWCEDSGTFGSAPLPLDFGTPVEAVPEALPRPAPPPESPVAPPSENPAEVRAYYNQAREVSVRR